MKNRDKNCQSDCFKDMLDRAVAAHQAGQFNEARILYEKLLDSDPENPDALYLLGGVYFKNNNPGMAAELLTRAIQSAPERDYLYNHLGLALKAMGHEDDALDAFNSALAINSRNPETYMMMGKTLLLLNRVSEAIDVFKQWLEIDPENEKAYHNLGAAFEMGGKRKEAEDAFQKAICFARDPAQARHRFGNYLLAQKQISKAIDQFNEAILVRPDFAQAYNSLGIALKSEGRLEEAINAYKKAIEINPKHPQTFNNLAVALNSAGKNQEAYEAYRTAISMKPDEPHFYQNFGIFLKSQGKLKDALIAFEQAVKLFPAFADAHHNMGTTLIEMGHPEKAMTSLKKAAQLDPQNHSAKYMVAALSGENPQSAPMEYVKELFSQYSNRFDSHLTGELSYQTPQLMRKALNDAVGADKKFDKVLDLGCGTGLTGGAFRDIAGHMTGVDLSREMIVEANKKGIYDQLTVSEINEFLGNCQDQFDLVLAADVFVYFGDLNPLFSCIEQRLNRSSYFLFSSESHPDDGYRLNSTGRFSHGKKYILALAEKYRFKTVGFTPVVLRTENHKPVEGEIFVFYRHG